MGGCFSSTPKRRYNSSTYVAGGGNPPPYGQQQAGIITPQTQNMYASLPGTVILTSKKPNFCRIFSQISGTIFIVMISQIMSISHYRGRQALIYESHHRSHYYSHFLEFSDM